MLLEKITYIDDFPIDINFGTIKNVPLHYHIDVEFVYVLQGEIHLQSGYFNYTLKAGDVFTNNGHEIHSLTSKDPNNVVAILHISNSFFTKYFPKLSKSVYRTYAKRNDGPRQDDLRRMLLQIFLHYLKKGLNYKNQCIYETIELIKYLNKYLNLFALDEKMVVSVDDDNPVTIERLSRIIAYLYENSAAKITLENISEMEHLSTFYLSHLIKEYTGMSFRDFLAFVRVERSEILLLDTNKKISAIAREVGFSTTAYYRKFFDHWYGHSPEEHRVINNPLVISPLNPEQIVDCSITKIIGLTTDLMSGIDPDVAPSLVAHNKIDLTVNVDAEARPFSSSSLSVFVTEEDKKVLGSLVDEVISDLNAKIILDSDNKISRQSLPALYGWDSISGLINVLKNRLEKTDAVAEDKYMRVPLRDQGDYLPLFKGRPSLLTSNGIKKPLYYAHLFLTLCDGEIISNGDYHTVIRKKNPKQGVVQEKKKDNNYTYLLLGYNYDASINNLCALSTSIHQTQEIIDNFKDELDLNINLKLPKGRYTLIRYTLNNENNLFNYMSQLDFPLQDAEDILQKEIFLPQTKLMQTTPYSDIATAESKGTATVNFTIKGPGVELVILKKQER